MALSYPSFGLGVSGRNLLMVLMHNDLCRESHLGFLLIQSRLQLEVIQ